VPLPSKLIENAGTAFQSKYGGNGAWTVSVAPGRVNLIGEHTDYNDGFVLPMAIERYVAVAFRATRTDRIRIWSDHFEEGVEFKASELRPGAVEGWGAYPAGICWAMQQRGHSVRGLDAVISADIPIGAGVSSSAALEVSFGQAVSEVSGLGLKPLELATISHLADNDFVGIPSGIMDQFASALCEEGHALLIDCRDLDFERVPVPPDVVFVVMDTGKRRGLVDSEYADRVAVAACRRVVEVIRRHRPGVTALRDVAEVDLNAFRGDIGEEDYCRALHVVRENDRTRHAAQALKTGDIRAFGQLMIESHESLRDLYEVSCNELDVAVDLALKHPDCFGARMTGGGFGGCALAMVRAGSGAGFCTTVSEEYVHATSLGGAFFPVRPARGVSLVKNPRG
jgi:galactokinase